jgi:hypothetical protein
MSRRDYEELVHALEAKSRVRTNRQHVWHRHTYQQALLLRFALPCTPQGLELPLEGPGTTLFPFMQALCYIHLCTHGQASAIPIYSAGGECQGSWRCAARPWPAGIKGSCMGSSAIQPDLLQTSLHW